MPLPSRTAMYVVPPACWWTGTSTRPSGLMRAARSAAEASTPATSAPSQRCAGRSCPARREASTR